MIYLGVDPGASGGLVALTPERTWFRSMPAPEEEVWKWFRTWVDRGAVAVIERVSGYVGGAGQPGSAMFGFGASYGGLRMALVAAGIPFDAVTPQVWQRALGIPHRKRAESRTAWKNRLKAEAERRFPHLKVTLATADALLIALYCLHKHGGRVYDSAPSTRP